MSYRDYFVALVISFGCGVLAWSVARLLGYDMRRITLAKDARRSLQQ